MLYPYIYIICQLYLNKTGNYISTEKETKNSLLVVFRPPTVRTILPTFQSDHVTSVLRTFLWIPIFLRAKPTDHTYPWLPHPTTFPAAYYPSTSPPYFISLHKVQCCLRVFALAKPSVWNALPFDIPRDNFVTSLKFLF